VAEDHGWTNFRTFETLNALNSSGFLPLTSPQFWSGIPGPGQALMCVQQLGNTADEYEDTATHKTPNNYSGQLFIRFSSEGAKRSSFSVKPLGES
jgi:hypothetical protein